MEGHPRHHVLIVLHRFDGMIAHVVEAGVAAIDPVLALHGAHAAAHGLEHADRRLGALGVVFG